MVSFMVVSAVAFAAWMRASRLPNSFLRRSSSSRLLAKAALAAAIDQVDAAIGNNPHPGIGQESPRPNAGITTSGSTGTQDTRTRNHWRGRVYIGTNQLHSTSETVSPLCVEALAYIPPPLVNEARYYSRRSDAAVWRRLGFDSGRYAFCAIDVSDYFDVNALAANVGRGASPATRISLAYLCENDAHTGYDTPPATWDEFMSNFRGTSDAEAEVDAAGQSSGSGSSSGSGASPDSNKLPLVSVADLNLALWDKKPGDFTSYFCQYFGGSGGSGSFYGGGVTADSSTGEKVKRMTFVTDGYFPPSSETASASNDDKDFDLADDAYQPFTRSDLKSSGTLLRTVMQGQSSQTAKRLRKGLCGLGLAMLWDYLDTDNVPLSLAIPSVERVPMITTVRPELEGQITVDPVELEPDENLTSDSYSWIKGTPDKSGAKWKRTVVQVSKYKINAQAFLKSLFSGGVRATVVYPFRRGYDPDSFRVEGHLALFFASEDMKLRYVTSDGSGGALHPGDGKDFFEKTAMQDGVFHVKLDDWNGTIPSEVKTKEDAVQDVDLAARNGASGLSAAMTEPFLTVVREYDQEATPPESKDDSPVWNIVGDPRVVQSVTGVSASGASYETKCAFPALKADGAVDESFTTGLLNYLNGANFKTFTLYAAVWLRVVDSDGKTVDLVPANMKDDDDFNGVDNYNSMTSQGPKIAGAGYPLMRFKGASFTFSEDGLGKLSGIDFAFQPKGVMCSDPRWNWAPEHWWKDDSASKATWLSNCGADGQQGRDSDIFMATSDAGYMQSVYELAMLPRLTNSDLRSYGADEFVGALETPDGKSDWPAAFGDTVNNQLVWKTYCPYARNGIVRDYFENVGNVTGRIVCEGGGTKVNPYSDSTNVVMAAFANTPTDWWAAAAQAENGVGVEVNVRKNAEQFNKTYAFNEMANSEVSKFAWKDLRQIAMNYIQKVHESNDANVDWEACFDNLDWDGENSEFCGLDTIALNTGDPKLSDVDRRFLYGFWRECFAARQQLFLVFVRAEPQMLGGGTARQVPPQLGVRAVALVWRDPTASTDDTTPHRTRVLFYRQFE